MVSIDSLYGKNVIETGGTIIGEIKGAEINTSSWTVTHLHVKLSNTASESLGFKKRFGSSMVCMPVSLITAVGDVVTINSGLNELSQHPLIQECSAH